MSLRIALRYLRAASHAPIHDSSTASTKMEASLPVE
jgi:hypothetical protein